MWRSLTEADLRFLVETVATRRRDSAHVISLVRDKEDLLEQMLEDPRLADREQRSKLFGADHAGQ